MNDIPKRSYSCGVLANQEFILVETYSGYRGGTHCDFRGVKHYLAPTAMDRELGLAILDCLSRSRWVLAAPREGFTFPPEVEFDPELFDYKGNMRLYAEWIDEAKARYAYKTKKALFKDMKSCGIKSRNGVITIRPSHHDKLEGWSGNGISQEDYVVLPASSPSEKIGEALRLAFSRCT
jgi:hypothetical protein